MALDRLIDCLEIDDATHEPVVAIPEPEIGGDHLARRLKALCS